MLAHLLGLIGEFFNCVGAVVLALDLLWRKKAQRELRNLADMSAFARSAGSLARYRGFLVASPFFAEDVMNWNAKKLALTGTIFLAIGFVLLLAYHVLEMG